MTSNRPYLIRALYEWIVDNAMTPYLLVNADLEGVEVPRQYIHEGKVVLNINPSAVQALNMGNDWLTFNARFSGTPMTVQLPIAAVMAIYARENGQGMVFNDQPDPTPPPPSSDGDKDKKADRDKRPALKVVK